MFPIGPTTCFQFDRKEYEYVAEASGRLGGWQGSWAPTASRAASSKSHAHIPHWNLLVGALLTRRMHRGPPGRRPPRFRGKKSVECSRGAPGAMVLALGGPACSSPEESGPTGAVDSDASGHDAHTEGIERDEAATEVALRLHRVRAGRSKRVGDGHPDGAAAVRGKRRAEVRHRQARVDDAEVRRLPERQRIRAGVAGDERPLRKRDGAARDRSPLERETGGAPATSWGSMTPSV